MQKRQAKIEALNTATDIIRAEIDSPNLTIEYGADQPTVHAYLEWIIRDLENKRDAAAYRQLKVDERKEERLAWLERIRKKPRLLAKADQQ